MGVNWMQLVQPPTSAACRVEANLAAMASSPAASLAGNLARWPSTCSLSSGGGRGRGPARVAGRGPPGYCVSGLTGPRGSVDASTYWGILGSSQRDSGEASEPLGGTCSKIIIPFMSEMCSKLRNFTEVPNL